MPSSEMPATEMTTHRPIDLDALTLDDVRGGALAGRPVTVLGPGAQRDRPRALLRAMPGPG